MYVPSWQTLSHEAILAQHHVSENSAGNVQIQITDYITFPLKLAGIKVLGCPIGLPDFCDSLIQSLIGKVENDLSHLRQFPNIHQRIKLATYCCNTRVVYLLRAVPLALTLPRMQECDQMFDNFMAHTLAFEPAYIHSQHAQAYLSALKQCRLGIKQGGLGLTSATLAAPAALHVALREFRSWYSNYADTWLLKAAHYQPWLQPATAPHIASADYYPYFRTEFDSTVSKLFQDWSITASAADTWPQHHLTHQMKEKLRATFLATLPADDAHRLEQVSLSSIPTRASTSDISPALSHDCDSLRQCPMGHFSLTCPFELSNAAIHTSTAILLGYPVPHARYLQLRPAVPPIDPWADMLLNDARHASATRHASHDAITNIIATMASSHGVSTSASLRLVPLADPDTMERGDLVVSASGILSALPGRRIPSKLILDFVLGHTYNSRHKLKRDTLTVMEEHKCRHYSQKYHEQGYAFAPLVANSFGQLGPEFLRFLWTLADHAARNYIPVPLPVLPLPFGADSSEEQDSPQVVRFKLLRSRIFAQDRLHVLTALYEAITHRVYGHTFPLQADAHYWAVLAQLSSIWTPSSQLLSQDPSTSSSHPASLPSSFLPLASYAAAVAGLRSSSSVVAPLPSALAQRTFSAHPCGSDGSLVDGVSACPLLLHAPSPLSARPLLSPALPLSPAASSS